MWSYLHTGIPNQEQQKWGKEPAFDVENQWIVSLPGGRRNSARDPDAWLCHLLLQHKQGESLGPKEKSTGYISGGLGGVLFMEKLLMET